MKVFPDKKAIVKKIEALDSLPLRWLRLRKEMTQALRPAGGEFQQVVFVIGCQRSGTNLMMEIFEHDWGAKTYDEFSKLSSKDFRFHIRLNPLDDVKRTIRKDRARLVVLKPLVETQNAHRLLDNFPGSKAIFMYRHYRDVAASNLKHWGMQNGINNLRPVVSRQEGNWRSENIPEPVRQTVLGFFSEDMKPYDAAALFWYVRNSFYFHLELDRNPSVMLLRYEDLVAQPQRQVDRVYHFLGKQHQGPLQIPEVYTSSVKRGRDLDLSPQVEAVCQEMLARLDQAYQAQGPAGVEG